MLLHIVEHIPPHLARVEIGDEIGDKNIEFDLRRLAVPGAIQQSSTTHRLHEFEQLLCGRMIITGEPNQYCDRRERGEKRGEGRQRGERRGGRERSTD